MLGDTLWYINISTDYDREHNLEVSQWYVTLSLPGECKLLPTLFIDLNYKQNVY